jgi:hypothetical protein
VSLDFYHSTNGVRRSAATNLDQVNIPSQDPEKGSSRPKVSEGSPLVAHGHQAAFTMSLKALLTIGKRSHKPAY